MGDYLRTENMQAYVDDLARRIELHGKGQNGEDQRMKNMVRAVEEPGYLRSRDEQSLYYWLKFANEQINFGREAVSEIEKSPDLLADTLVGFVVKVIKGGWEYGELFLRLLQSMEAANGQSDNGQPGAFEAGRQDPGQPPMGGTGADQSCMEHRDQDAGKVL